MPTASPIFVGLLIGVILLVGALSFFPALALGPLTEASHREALVTAATTSLLDPAIARAALLDSVRKLDPRALLRNPVILSVWVVSVLVTGQLAVDIAQGHAVAFEAQIVIWLWLTVLFANFAEALAEGRGKAQAESLRKTRTTTIARLLGAGDVEEPRPAPGSARRRPRRLRGRRRDPGRRRDRRGHRIGRRVRRDRRVGARDPRVGWRPLRRHRRHARPQRPHRDPRHGESRRDVPRPHDRARRGRGAPAHAQRDRALDPARRHEPDLPRRLRSARADGAPRRRRHHAGRARGALRLAHPDDDRGAALGDRHRRHEPARAPQRARDVGPRRRGRRRRLGAAARQDRHDHARQPPGGALPARLRASRSASSQRPRSSRRCRTRRRRAAPSSCSPRSCSTSAAATSRLPPRASSRSRRRRA